MALAGMCSNTYQQRQREGAHIDTVAFVDLRAKGDVPLPRDQQGEAEEAQFRALLFGVSPLRQLRAHVGGGDEGEEVGGIVEERIELDPEPAHDALGEFVLDRAQRLELHAVRLVPEEL